MKRRIFYLGSSVVITAALFVAILHKPDSAVLMLTSGQEKHKAEKPAEGLPPGIDGDWYAQVMENIRKEEYHITFHEQLNAYQSPNKKNNLRLIYCQNGFRAQPARTKIPLFDRRDRTIPDEAKTYHELEDWCVGLTLNCLSKGEGRISFAGKEFCVRENTASIEDENLRLEYLNDEQGMRQDFFVKEKPAGKENLTLELQVETELKVNVGRDGLLFTDNQGAAQMKYHDLKVWDANGTKLAASFESLSPLQHDNQVLVAIVVDDAEAQYPVTIDPLSSTEEWTAESNQDSGYFGCSVATAGDVNGDGYSDVIVGADHFDSGELDDNAARLLRCA